jgi:hypothetical protein
MIPLLAGFVPTFTMKAVVVPLATMEGAVPKPDEIAGAADDSSDV